MTRAGSYGDENREAVAAAVGEEEGEEDTEALIMRNCMLDWVCTVIELRNVEGRLTLKMSGATMLERDLPIELCSIATFVAEIVGTGRVVPWALSRGS